MELDVKFVCPDCKGEEMEVLIGEALVQYQVKLEGLDLIYSSPTILESHNLWVQCGDCGKVFDDMDEYDEGIVMWLIEQSLGRADQETLNGLAVKYDTSELYELAELIYKKEST